MVNDTPKTIEIPLTKGYIAIVDEVDADLLQHKWYAQNCNSRHYAARRIDTKNIILLHRFILGRVLKVELTTWQLCDHMDRDSMNCRRSNLRLATPIQNAHNQGICKTNKSGFKGVALYQRDNVWNSSIRVDGKTLFLGVYNTAEDAAIAYNYAALKYFGEFAFLNDIPEWQSKQPERRRR